MAKKRAAAQEKKPPASPVLRWDAVITCQSRGCGRQEHRVCVEAAQRPADHACLPFRCPVTRMLTAVRFGAAKWREVSECPAGAIVIRPKLT